MQSVRRIFCLIGSFAAAILVSPNGAIAEFTIQTNDGRIFTGEVDDQTNEHRLWLRQESEQIMLTSSFAWTEIAAATDGERDLAGKSIPTAIQALATSEPEGFLLQPSIDPVVVACSDCETHPRNGPARDSRRRPVRSLEMEAFLVNLDRDVEPDGIQLAIAALDEQGLPVSVKGSLAVRLWGERIQPHGSLVRYESIEQWSQRVDVEDFVDGTASYPMRFRRVNPEFDTALHADALVNVRLSVFGQGNFEASVPVQIRAFNPVRDRLQLTRGSRLFPDELTENVRRQLPHRTYTRRVRTR
ncbi:MAG: hypothetical protein AAGD11_09685 [Planctomycetota bacterium]